MVALLATDPSYLKAESRIPADIRPLSVALVGTYGLRVQWSDGHGTGIYTFERLLAICPCERCRAEHESP